MFFVVLRCHTPSSDIPATKATQATKQRKAWAWITAPEFAAIRVEFAQMRAEFEALAAEYLHDNVLRQDFLMTRAVKI